MPWVNISDGGHIENLGVYELLRRRCRIVIVGDGEADSRGKLEGLTCLMRLAEIDLGVKIDFAPDAFDFLSPEYEGEARHYAIGKIYYPAKSTDSKFGEEEGYLVYLKSSYQGNEDQILSLIHI